MNCTIANDFDDLRGHFHLFFLAENNSNLLFRSLIESPDSKRSNEGRHCRWSWLTFKGHLRRNTIVLSIFQKYMLCTYEVNYNGRVNYFYWRIRPEWLLYRLMLKKVKAKVLTLAIAPITWVRLVTSSALQSRQLIGMSQWCRSALCGHPLPALTDNWTHGAASRHTIAPISHTRSSPRNRSYYSFPVPLRVGGWIGLSTH